MSYPTLLSEVGTTPPFCYVLFERFAFLLLTELAKKRRKPHPVVATKTEGADFYLKKGIDPEQKNLLLVDAQLAGCYSTKQLRHAERLAAGTDTDVLLVVSGKPSNLARKRLASGIHRVTVWDYNKLTRLVESLGPAWVSETAIPALRTDSVQLVVPASAPAPEAWKEKRREHVAALQEARRSNCLVPFIGAGVSAGAGLKNWTDLLNSIAAEVVAKSASPPPAELKQLVRRFVELNDASPLILARYLRMAIGEDEFAHRVASVLYEGVATNESGTSPAYESIAKLCIPRRTGCGVNAVVNYNYDDLLHKHLEASSVQAQAVSRVGERVEQDALPVYHVHGYLPREVVSDPASIPENIVLSEEAYHKLYSSPYDWSNLIQLDHLRNSTCLFIGHSLTDPNLRRLLAIAAKHDVTQEGDRLKPRHYAILRRWSLPAFTHSNVPQEVSEDGSIVKARVKVVNVEDSTTRAFIATHHASEESLYQEFSLNVVWVEGFDEIPGIINAIRGNNYAG
jgi:hypothetical protein